MGSMSIMHWLIVLIILAAYVVPVVKILHQAGYSGWWVLISFIPLGNIVGLWIFAFARWPAVARAQS